MHPRWHPRIYGSTTLWKTDSKLSSASPTQTNTNPPTPRASSIVLRLSPPKKIWPPPSPKSPQTPSWPSPPPPSETPPSPRIFNKKHRPHPVYHLQLFEHQYLAQQALRDILMPRGKKLTPHCLAAIFDSQLFSPDLSLEHPNCLLKCLQKRLSTTREGFLFRTLKSTKTISDLLNPRFFSTFCSNGQSAILQASEWNSFFTGHLL